MMILLETIQTLATVAIAMFAFQGLQQWKKEIRGQNQYKTLIDIKVKLSTFKNLFQDVRLDIIRQICEISEENYPTIKEYYQTNGKRLWDFYTAISNAINMYSLIEPQKKDFLLDELREINLLISHYIISAEFYCDYKAKKRQLDDDTESVHLTVSHQNYL